MRSKRRRARLSSLDVVRPNAYWNASSVEARYLLVMTPKIARLIEAIHEPGDVIPALFAEYDSEILPSA